MLEAENDFVFQLADVVDAQGLHELIVGHDSLPGGNIGNGDELEFPDLRGFQLQEVSWAFLVLDNCVVSEQI